jgi:hypothetical protein
MSQQVDKAALLRDHSRNGNLDEVRKLLVKDKELNLNATNAVSQSGNE